jgi:two-component system cell cycle response regulator
LRRGKYLPRIGQGSFTAVKILLVDDSKMDRLRVSECLEESGFEYVAADNGTDAWEILQAPDAPTFALLDWVMPGIDGIELCRRIRTLGSNGTYIYTVMLTAKDRKQNLLTAMDAGADDYLAKPVDPCELRARILAGKRILDLQQCLRFSATHDFLTNLLSRAEILASLERELVRTQREGRPAGVIMADVDGFKQINDTLGHPAGDAVLAEVARRLKSDLRLYDVAGRYGGEEFILVLPGCDLRTATRRADEIRRLVARDPIATPAGSVSVSVSMGVTAAHGDSDSTLETLLQNADAALYRAKKAGRNRVDGFSLNVRVDGTHRSS